MPQRRTATSRARLLAAALVLGAGPAAADPSADYQAGYDAYLRQDLFGAIQTLRRAADQGYAPAQALLGHILDQAEENADAREFYTKAADQGNAEGQYGLGMLYARGEGVDQSDELAVKWLTLAADANYGPAIVALADAHLRGKLGLTRDRARGLKLLERGAAQGYEPAQRVLARETAPPPAPAPAAR